jgi:predicted RNA methylase
VRRAVSGVLDRVAYRWLALEDQALERRLGVDTAGSVGLDGLTVDPRQRSAGFAYVASPGRLVDVVVAQASRELPTTAFVDLGSGKGRVVTRAALHPFRRVVGVEFARELHDLARANVETLARTWPSVAPTEVVHLDASRFEFPPGDVLAYLNNPFAETVMRPVVANLEAAIRRGGRATVVYQQARVEDDPTDNLAILRASPMLVEQPVRFRGRLDRWLLRPFDIRRFDSVAGGPVPDEHRSDP